MKESRPVFWVSAKGAPEEGNPYDCKAKIREICAQLGSPRIERLDCGSSPENAPQEDRDADAGDVIRVIRNRNMFDPRPRVIILKGLPPNYTILTDYLKFINKQNYLIIDGPFGLRADPPSTKFVSAKASNFYKTIDEMGHAIEIPSAAKNVGEAVKWCEKVSAELGKPIELDAAKKLTDMVGLSFDTLYGALNRLVDYANGKRVTPSDVDETCDPSFMDSVWDLIEYIDRGDCESALTHLQRFYEVSSLDVDSVFIGEVEMLLGALHHHFMFCLLVADYCFNHKSQLTYKSAEAATTNIKSKNKDGEWKNAHYSPQFLGMAVHKSGIRSVLGWRRRRIYNAYTEIVRIRNMMHSEGHSPAKTKLYLDTLIMFLCEKLTKEEAADMRGEIDFWS